jgi:hypothetical protein
MWQTSEENFSKVLPADLPKLIEQYHADGYKVKFVRYRRSHLQGRVHPHARGARRMITCDQCDKKYAEWSEFWGHLNPKTRSCKA